MTVAKADREKIEMLIVKLRHPMVNLAAAHEGIICQQERLDAARWLETLLKE